MINISDMLGKSMGQKAKKKKNVSKRVSWNITKRRSW
jgi:hypothetical protein